MNRTVVPGRAEGTVDIPGSKSYTHRFAVAAGLSRGRTVRIVRALRSTDTFATARGLRRLGARIAIAGEGWSVRGPARYRLRRPVTIDCGESGTTLRLLCAAAALFDRPVTFTGRGRLPMRPLEPLTGALEGLGARVRRPRAHRSIPVTIEGPISPGALALPAADSSQPVSALMLALAAFPARSRLTLVGPVVSRPYVDATAATLRAFGARADHRGRAWGIGGPLVPPRRRLEVPPDASSAAYAWAAAAATGGSVTVRGTGSARNLRWPQADLALLGLLRRMGARVRRTPAGVRVDGPLRRPVRADLADSPDLAPLVGVLAAVVPEPGTSVLAPVRHLALKESDRAAATASLARAVGARVRMSADGTIRIRSRPPVLPFSWDGPADHRVVMSAAVGALAAGGPCRIGPAEAVSKSFPRFWSMIRGWGSGGAGRDLGR
ncbi:MAG: 3-phosphoshikimate 1-carboxyvinyltransferase [Thermoplasmata archaeon]